MHRILEVEHIFHRHNLKLHTNAFVTISSIHCNDPPCQVLPGDLEALLSSGTWIAGGNQLQIYVQLLFDGKLPQALDNGELIEEIGLMICNAKVLICISLCFVLLIPR